MIQAEPRDKWVGKTVAAVEGLGMPLGRAADTLFDAKGVRITFTDGEVLLLKGDTRKPPRGPWYAVINQHAPSASLDEVPLEADDG